VSLPRSRQWVRCGSWGQRLLRAWVYALERPEGANGRLGEISKCACTSTCTDISPLACTPENGWCISAVWKSRSRSWESGPRMVPNRGPRLSRAAVRTQAGTVGPMQDYLLVEGDVPLTVRGPWSTARRQTKGDSLRPQSGAPGALCP